jgi:TolB-like protein
MPSLIPGYNYDIFISYRQKDNKGDKWVSEFVEALKTELESTFKEDISVYFDINPHDGLLETHDVNASLQDKLKCLIFIPIISRTYCDPKSFAWEHEFKAFISEASKDQFGLKVKLPNGNIASRVLPIRIHDLDVADIKECESVLGGLLRGVEFIYKEPGVNRPLTTKDNEDKNLNHSNYRNQINKVALAIKEIVSGLKKEPVEYSLERNEVISFENKAPIKEKSIIVLPFENISPDPNQEYFSDGLTEEIITDLSHIHDLLVISRSSAMTFKGTKKTIPEIAQAVKVRYVLEGSVRKAGNNLRITAQLIDSITDAHLWAEVFSGSLDDVFNIQENVSHVIVSKLKLKLTADEEHRITVRPLTNIHAYDAYLRARQDIYQWTEAALERARLHLEGAVEIIGENALLLAGLGSIYSNYAHAGIRMDEATILNAERYANKALELEPDLAQGHSLLASIAMARGQMKEGFKYSQCALSINPYDPDALFWLVATSCPLGKTSLTEPFAKRLFEIDPLSPLTHISLGIVPWLKGQFKSALESFRTAFRLDTESIFTRYWLVSALAANHLFEEAEQLLLKWGKQTPGHPMVMSCKFFVSAIYGKKAKALKYIIEEWTDEAWKDYWLPLTVAEGYALIGETEDALGWLNRAFEKGWINYPFLSEIDPFLENIRGEERFKKLMERVKYEWENFEV